MLPPLFQYVLSISFNGKFWKRWAILCLTNFEVISVAFCDWGTVSHSPSRHSNLRHCLVKPVAVWNGNKIWDKCRNLQCGDTRSFSLLLSEMLLPVLPHFFHQDSNNENIQLSWKLFQHPQAPEPKHYLSRGKWKQRDPHLDASFTELFLRKNAHTQRKAAAKPCLQWDQC